MAGRGESRRVAGKKAIVTGASGDLGGPCAALLARHGAEVACLDTVPPGGSAPADGLHHWQVDVTEGAEVHRVVEEVAAAFGGVDVLVNAAGVLGKAGPSHLADEDDFDAVFDVNVKGTWLVTKCAMPHLIRSGRASVVNFSSIHGLTGGSNVPLYHAAKGAVRLLSKADAVTYGPRGVRVNSVHPGSMNTRMSRDSAARSGIGSEQYYRKLVSGNPIARQGEPDEVAHAVLYLASDEAAFTTGSELVVDGGFTAQ
ncbi:SDR family oxidoreductase [Saccharopolyspora sp. HNM0983]|uniref:SDR family oxidoreductase n=1 Tax=Saccharopolyspora montiporae TaxID=2781240 RepID=A0A929BDG7_9PSEU|nr:SDR family oxidoreductase [Saccharopolyspora sp. HNM0983]MBE9376033.1 SDR family oxidoreductase [Saccharopolyspora sp. HNM0983]